MVRVKVGVNVREIVGFFVVKYIGKRFGEVVGEGEVNRTG